VDSHEAAGVGNRTSAIRQLAIRSARRADVTQREDHKKFEAQIRRRPPQQWRTQAGRKSSHAVSSEIQSFTLKSVFEAGTP
jgi:hypothetical protein